MCEAYRDKLPAYAAETLADNDRARVEAHLASCAACRSTLADWRAIGIAVRGLVATRAVDLPAYLPPDLVPTAETAAGPSWRMLAGNGRWLALLILLALTLTVPLALRSANRDISLGQIKLGWISPDPISPDQISPGQFEPGPAIPVSRMPALAPTPVTRSARPISRVRPSPLVAASDRARSNDAASNIAPSDPSANARIASAANHQAATGLTNAIGAIPTAPTAPVVMSTSVTTAVPDPSAGSSPRSEDPPDLPFTPSPPPSPLPPPTGTPIPTTGTIAGMVRGPDQQPRAEILIVAEIGGGGAGGSVYGMTDVTGAYSLTLSPGEWIVHAETPAYQLMWHVGKPNPIFADPVAVAIGAVVTVDFALEPSPAGLITGRVTDAGGAPVARAVVIAAIPDDGPNRSPVLSAAVFTDDTGEYRLAVPPGAYFLATSLTRQREDLVWWGGDGSFGQSDRVGVSGSGPVRGIDIVLGR